MKGNVIKYEQDNIDTDVIIPGTYLKIHDYNELAKHAMEGIDPDFHSKVNDGDFIVAKKTSIARSGQIVVAIINGEATLKCYVPNSRGIELHPRNPKFPIITVDPTDDFHINGVLLYSFRNYLN